MCPRWLPYALMTFLVLSSGLIANVVLLQPPVDRRTGGDVAGLHGMDRLERARKRRPISDADTPVTGAIRRASGAAVDPATVKAVQRELEHLGYSAGLADGAVGLITRAAVMAFEHDRGMPLTGEPSDEVLRAILLDASPSLGAEAKAPQGAAVDVIKIVQRSLRQIGYRINDPDGVQGEGTIRAIRQFEVSQQLEESGRISGPLIARLGRRSDPADETAHR